MRSTRDVPGPDDLYVMSNLSPDERIQLAHADAPNGNEWRRFRHFVATRDKARRPQTDPGLMAYTPGETTSLFHEPQVGLWHRDIVSFEIPKEHKLVVFVPCAATKPWEGATRGIYKSYNELRAERDAGKLPDFYMVTVSEPLGVVPEKHWGDFPPYENPGLFQTTFMRFGMTNKEIEEFFGRKVRLPFDQMHYLRAIEQLGTVIGEFAERNKMRGRRFISFVEGTGEKSTHSDMLDVAVTKSEFLAAEHRFEKREKSREAPYAFLKKKIRELYPKSR